MTRYDRDAVLAAVDLAEVLSREVGPPSKRGSEWWWPSVDPAFAGTGRTPPTHLIPNRGGSGPAMFKDFASGTSGTAIDVVMLNRGVDFATALEALAVEHGVAPAPDGPGWRPIRGRPPGVGLGGGGPVQRPDRAPPNTRGQPPARPDADTNSASGAGNGAGARTGAERAGRVAASWEEVRRPPSDELVAWVRECADRLATSRQRAAGRARAWLRGRGFGDGFLVDNLVGYDPGARHDRHRPAELRERHGIPKMSGVTFPHFDVAGQVSYVQTRNLGWTPDSGYPKYVNPTGVLNPRFGIWADLDPHLRAGAPVVITEGPTDSLTARQAGFDVAGVIGANHAGDPATATSLIAALGADRPYVVLTDPDPAGHQAGQLLVVHLWIGGAVALHRPPPLDGDVSDWAAATAPAFPRALHAHVDHALAGASDITRRALAGDPSFLTRAAGGPLGPAAAAVWASYLDAALVSPSGPVTPASARRHDRPHRQTRHRSGRDTGPLQR